MKIKRKEYERLIEAAGKLGNLERIQMVIRTVAPNGTQPELLRTNLLHYIDRFAIWSDAPFTESRGWIAGPIQLEFIRLITGYDYFVKQKFGAQCPETIAPMSPGTPDHAPDSETKATTGDPGTPTSQEEETTTENGKTDGASPPNASPVEITQHDASNYTNREARDMVNYACKKLGISHISDDDHNKRAVLYSMFWSGYQIGKYETSGSL